MLYLLIAWSLAILEPGRSCSGNVPATLQSLNQRFTRRGFAQDRILGSSGIISTPYGGPVDSCMFTAPWSTSSSYPRMTVKRFSLDFDTAQNAAPGKRASRCSKTRGLPTTCRNRPCLVNDGHYGSCSVRSRRLERSW